jgi:hypothetical protein
MREMMIDLETLDVRPCSLVLTIGAVVFDTINSDNNGTLEWQIADRFLRKPGVLEQILIERSINEHTVRWWRKQGKEARQEAFDEVRQSLRLCFNDLAEFAQEHDIKKFWANPVTFDLIILEELAEASGNKVPWTYRQRFDLRTVVNEASYSTKDHVKSPGLRQGHAHEAVYDCEFQVDILTAVRNKVRHRVA